MPEVFLGHQPPPSTWFPCHALISQHGSDFFSKSKTPIVKDFVPIQSSLLIELVQNEYYISMKTPASIHWFIRRP
jgi:hypothetical protein